MPPSPNTPAPTATHRPELLAPAGDWECARAAVENGADAIYFGLERFNARMRAHNFTLADLPALMAFLHERGVRGYVTFNTLVFADELDAAADYLRAIIAAGVDAAIVQDIGICRLIRRLSPDFPIHCSTQMTISSGAGTDFARDLDAHLVVLARENSIKEINAIQEAQAASGRPLPLEVFVHGALCVAYSGQCLTSESLGGRSANRGECAQACRLPYELISDGQKVDLGDRAYLLSPQDLAGLDVLPELVRAGVASLKIEGRLKSPEYVASITRTYRRALDQILEAAPPAFDREAARYELEMSFSRGLYTGWFNGIHNQELAHGRFGTKRGRFLGRVTRVQGDRVFARLESPLKAGDGVAFDAGRHAEGEEGGRIYTIDTAKSGESVLTFGRGAVNFGRVHVGDRLWKTSDPALGRELRATFAGDKVRFTRPIRAEVHGHAGAPLTLILDDGEGHQVKVASSAPLAVAEQRPLDTERLRQQLGRLGGTPFQLGELANHLEGEVIVPLSELNQLRRDAVAQLTALRQAPLRWALTAPDPTTTRVAANATAVPTETAPELIVVTRDLAQFEAALTCPGISTFYCEFENPKHYREAVTRFRSHQQTTSDFEHPTSNLSTAKPSIWVAPPRVFKPGEEWILKQVRSCEADGFLARHHEHLRFFADDRVRGDFSLNVANPLTAEFFRERYGLERVTASYDLNIGQLEALLQNAPGDWFDITIHQHMPMFHMEHCVFCAFLSSGKDYHDCGRPCEKHRVALRDRVGAQLPLKADAGCRNTVYNNRAQTGAEYVDRLVALGARYFRVEFVHESPDEIPRTIAAYQRLLRGELTGSALWQELKLLNQLGVTRGQMETGPRTILKKRS
ncbi:U32 family peptidase [Actomonas aquatica]|uniref:U32 family peptidase n=1 Tax=Actomonas aquatica TaxID=2866162 RepID=A0ABZ1CEU4_9BACT|nr:U32 family peptidase [Opitutus sp. WL0086]WRQ89885.1 U32 family peptidase [Opitutus sp. WL0086]